MHVTHYSSPPLPLVQQIALDQLLLAGVSCGQVPELVRFYSCVDEGIVLGIAQNPATTVHADRARQERLSVLKRFSGGGTVLIGHGCLLFTIVLETGKRVPPYAVRRAYEYVFEPLIAAFSEHGIPVAFHPPCDLAVHGRKIAGTAQAQKRGAVLVHGCLLIDEDLARIERCLRHPPAEPAYRRGRPHGEFLCNLSELGLDRAATERILSTAWASSEPPRHLDKELLQAARTAVQPL